MIDSVPDFSLIPTHNQPHDTRKIDQFFKTVQDVPGGTSLDIETIRTYFRSILE